MFGITLGEFSKFMMTFLICLLILLVLFIKIVNPTYNKNHPLVYNYFKYDGKCYKMEVHSNDTNKPRVKECSCSEMKEKTK